jgi:hypothetical protein
VKEHLRSCSRTNTKITPDDSCTRKVLTTPNLSMPLTVADATPGAPPRVNSLFLRMWLLVWPSAAVDRATTHCAPSVR